jgi:DNA-binding transcriptional regulator YiaG
MADKYEKEQLKVCHDSARALYRIGAIDAARMREFDEMCLTPEVAPSQRTVNGIAKQSNKPIYAPV